MTSGRFLTVQHLDVFARHPGGGNPCPVVTGASHLPEDEMQLVAAYFGHETVFAGRDEDGAPRWPSTQPTPLSLPALPPGPPGRPGTG